MFFYILIHIFDCLEILIRLLSFGFLENDNDKKYKNETR